MCARFQYRGVRYCGTNKGFALASTLHIGYNHLLTNRHFTPIRTSMKMPPLYVLTLLVLVGGITSTIAQGQSDQADEAQRMAAMQHAMAARQALMRSPAVVQAQSNAMRQTMSSLWDGDRSMHITMGFLQREDFREGIGVSEEQLQSIMRAPQDRLNDDPRVQQIREEMIAFQTQNGDPFFGENASDATRRQFVELQMRMETTVQEFIMETTADAMQQYLAPEQIQRIREAQISTMSAIPIISPSMFEALDLSEAQRGQLEEIRTAMQPAFEQRVEELANVQMMQMQMKHRVQEALERINGIPDLEERRKMMEHLQEEIHRVSPDIHRAMNAMQESGRAFSEALKFRMFDVLTDAQWARMVDLVDNPPEYIKRMFAEASGQRDAGDSPSGPSSGGGWVPGTDAWQPGGWVPGADSWRPGDAIPGVYRIERNERSRFPRGE